MAKRRQHASEFKRQAVERMKAEVVVELARELNIDRRLLYKWKYQMEGHPEERRADLTQTAEQRKQKRLSEEITRLKSALADRTMEVDFFRTALLKIKEARQGNTSSGVTGSTRPSARGTESKAH